VLISVPPEATDELMTVIEITELPHRRPRSAPGDAPPRRR
jgi:hypothetical protein